MNKKHLFAEHEFKTPAMCTEGGTFDCVSVAINGHGVAVKSTNDPEGTTVVYTHEEWRNFISAVRGGSFSV